MRVDQTMHSRIGGSSLLAIAAACQAVLVWGALALFPADGRAIQFVSIGNLGAAKGASGGVALSSDGTAAAFYSDASNLVVGDTNQSRDVFVRNLLTGQIQRVSVSTAGVQANAPSQAASRSLSLCADGRYVVFDSNATNLVDNDTNQQADVFIRDRAANVTERISVSTAGAQANGASIYPSISADGRFVVFQSQASNLVSNDTNGITDIFVRDRVTGTTERICDTVQGNGASFSPAISGDGRW